MDISWKKIKETPYKAGYRKMIKRTFVLPHGNDVDFDLVEGGKVVCILPLTIDKQVILTKQFRPAQDKILSEIPGRGVNVDENENEAAARELLEETGYVGKLEFVGISLESAYNTIIRYNYIAIDCVKVQEPKLEDNNEPLKICFMSLVEFRKHLKSGELTDVATGYLGLDHLNLL